MADAVKKVCFVIGPIGNADTEIRKRADQVLHHIITPAVKECGFDEVTRADGITEAGIIPTQIIQRVIDADLVIADLTDKNPNVYYELAVRHAVKKPYVQIIQAGETIPFDITTVRTISVDHKDLDSVEKCKRDIVNQVQHGLLHSTEIDSPISVAIDIKSLRQSENPADKMAAEIVTMLQNFQVSIDEKLDQRLSNLEKKVETTYRWKTQLSLSDFERFISEYEMLVQTIIESKTREKDPNINKNIYVISSSVFELGAHFSELAENGEYPLYIRGYVMDLMDRLMNS